MTFKIGLGSKVKDPVTGFKGIVTSRTEYMNGCIRYGVTPKGDGSTCPDAVWLDEEQITVIVPRDVTAERLARTGGPRPAPRRAKDAPSR